MNACPWCGNEYDFSYFEIPHPMYEKGVEVGKVWFVRTACLSCGACGPWVNDTDQNTADKLADDSWNKRLNEVDEE